LDPTQVDPTLYSAFEGNSTADTELAIAGYYKFNDADPTVVGPATGPGVWLGTPNQSLLQFIIPTVINLDKAAGSNGNFTPDDQMPGLPGTSGQGNGTDAVAAEILYWVQIPTAGTITFGVNSDDGFRTKIGGVSPADISAQVAGEFNGGRGASDTTFAVKFDAPGLYAFRTTFENGTGGCNIEMFSELADGTKVLLNDTANGGLKAFRAITGSIPAFVSSASPGQGGTVPYGGSLQYQITDGSTATVDSTSVKLKIDGTAVNATVAKSGSITSISFTPSPFFASGSSHTAEIDYTAGGTAASKTITFKAGKYALLTKANAVTPDKTKPGFLWDYFQNEGPQANGGNDPNIEYFVDQVAQGNWGLTNEVDTTVLGPATSVSMLGSGPNALAEFVIPTVINMDKAAGSNGHFTPQDQMTGTPGTTSASNGQFGIAKTYLDLPAGTITMGVTSDDGFRVYAGMTGDVLAQMQAGEFDTGRGASDTTFNVIVQDAGVYPFVMQWENGTGGSNVSWWSMKGTNFVLIGDTANGGIPAYRAITSTTPPKITSITPEPNDNYNNNAVKVPYGPFDGAVNLVKLTIADGTGTKVDTSSVQLQVDGAAVTPTVTSASGVTTVSYTPTTRLADNSDHTGTIMFKDSAGAGRTNSWNFHVGYVTSDTLFIEAEDWDYSHGKYVKTGHIGMDGPYPGGSYVGLGDTSDDPVDYHVDSASPSGTPPWYRPSVNASPGKVNGSGFNGRGYFKVQQWWTLGWNDAGNWQNYTRDFPATAQDYEVFGHLASGGSAIAIQMDQVTAGVGQDDSAQTKKMLGVFAPGRATAGWDTLEIFKLTADTNGTPTTVHLGGNTTLRLTMLPGSNEDIDYIAFRPVAGGGGGGGGNTNAVFSAISVSADRTSAVLTYTGTLQSSAVVTGPYSAVAGATSPATVTISKTGNLFYRVK
jgi:hypothetical protein